MKMLRALVVLTFPFLALLVTISAAAAEQNETLQLVPPSSMDGRIKHLKQTHECPYCGLSGANLTVADLRGADLRGADLSGIDLRTAGLIGADLSGADLSGTNLSLADLREADLSDVNLSKAELIEAKLTNVRFEPTEVPAGVSLREATGLDTLRWGERDKKGRVVGTSHGLVLLRNAFKASGMRQQERQVTYSLMHSNRINEGCLAGALQLVLFEWTTQWGMSPGRPLWILLTLIPVFGLLYMVAITNPSGRSAVWRIWDKERIYKDEGLDAPEQLISNGYRALLFGYFFSALSAFHVGRKEVNVGSWIARLNPYQYTLQGTGWVRTASGIQSLISVYLLALAVLTYFGRPFEW